MDLSESYNIPDRSIIPDRCLQIDRRFLQSRLKRKSSLPSTTQDLEQRPTLTGVARELTGRVFSHPAPEEPMVPFHRRELERNRRAVNREEEENPDPELPTYRESTRGRTTMPSPPLPVHFSDGHHGPIIDGVSVIAFTIPEQAPPKYEVEADRLA
ncbi:hypothetical protein M231_07812 [Tremella mesenterica]|uniref:Uncharacterized protein n=1 Tax=Tremella mesenterica TaxID=5217 RepID=A0A4Q1BFD1_TREME|nr:uncharacterized protein TREMEDRAFT_60532 [Tremella mesenterica DSM 1558]EIW71610.1 hypothetical protein TREMEDRAFT_60532 [Tremella mesenterica DSM 1558]RXK34941.1 hypothetical protein M231_07812 [Tremella mesenterica]